MSKPKDPVQPPHEPEVEATLQRREATKRVAVKFSAEIAERVCRGIGEGGTLRQTCAHPGMPNRLTVLRWVRENTDGFAARYHLANEARAYFWAEEMLDLADSATNDTWNVARLKIDTRKWLATKFYPRMFGERIAHQQLDQNGEPTDPQRAVTDTLQAALECLDMDELRTLRGLLRKCGFGGVELDGGSGAQHSRFHSGEPGPGDAAHGDDEEDA